MGASPLARSPSRSNTLFRAAFFAAGAGKRAAAEAGSTRAVTEREADDLVRDADRFLGVVESCLGLVPHTSAESQLYVVATGPGGWTGVA